MKEATTSMQYNVYKAVFYTGMPSNATPYKNLSVFSHFVIIVYLKLYDIQTVTKIILNQNMRNGILSN